MAGIGAQKATLSCVWCCTWLETFHPMLQQLVFCFNILGGHGMIQIGSVVIVSSELSLKTVTYESWGSSGPDLQDQTSTWSIWSTYVPRKNDLSIFIMYIHSRSEGFPWTGYSIPIINYGWWMMDRWWCMMDGRLVTDGGWLMMDDDGWHDGWFIISHPSSIMSHPPVIHHQSSTIQHQWFIINHLHDTWKRSSSWRLSYNPFKFCHHPCPRSNLFRCFGEKHFGRKLPRLIATNCPEFPD